MRFKKRKLPKHWYILMVVCIAVAIFAMFSSNYLSLINDPLNVDEDIFGISVFISLCFLFGIGPVVLQLYFIRQDNKLIEEEKYVVCTDIRHEMREQGYKTYGNGRSETIYVNETFCEYTDENGKTYTFKSETYNEDTPNPFIRMDKIIVFVDLKANPKHYYMYPYSVDE